LSNPKRRPRPLPRKSDLTEAMYRITQIEPQKKDENRVNVYLDGAFAFGLKREILLTHHLHEGDKISNRLIDEVLLSEEKSRAKEKALSLLSYHARSIEELKKKLLEKDFSERAVNHVIEDFCRVGLLNDKMFASDYSHSRMMQRPIGKRLLKQELVMKGISEEIAEKSVEEEYEKQTEEEVAESLIRKRLKRYGGEDPQKVRKKLSEFLFRRGFNWDVISSVLSEVEIENVS
jgi:regulatory protein